MKLKELLDIATLQLRELTTLDNPDFRLEQAELNSKDNSWEIVVSFLVTNTNKRVMPDLTAFQFHRIYKKVKINGDKEVVGFYIFDNKE